MHWHPAAVHIPVALLGFALAIDLAALARRRPAWHRFAYATLVSGTLGAVLAVITGNLAAADHRSTAVSAAIQTHEDLATGALLLALLATLGRLPGLLRDRAAAGQSPGARGGGPGHRGTVSALWIAVTAAAVVLTALAGYRGGELVYEGGVGVRGAAASPASP